MDIKVGKYYYVTLTGYRTEPTGLFSYNITNEPVTETKKLKLVSLDGRGNGVFETERGKLVSGTLGAIISEAEPPKSNDINLNNTLLWIGFAVVVILAFLIGGLLF